MYNSVNNPTTTGYSNPTTTGYSNPTTTGYSNPTTTGYSNPTTTGYSNPTTTGYSNPTTTRYSNPTTTTGYSNPTTTGSIPYTTQPVINDITQLLPNLSSETIVSLLNSGVDLMKLYADTNYMSEKGMNFDSEMKSPSTNIYQKNFSGTSNVYSPYLYYNKNSNGNQLPENINSVLGATTTTRPMTTMGNTTTTRPMTTMATTTTTRPTTTMATTTTKAPTTTMATTTTIPMTTMATTTTKAPTTTMATTTTIPMTTMGNTTTTMGNTTTTMGNTTTTMGNTTTTMGNTTTTMGNTTTTKAPTTTTYPTIQLVENILNPPEEKRSYSSIYGNNNIGTGHARSMLYSPQSWTPQSTIKGEYMTIDLEENKTVIGTITQGRQDKKQYVKTYKVSTSIDGINYNFITQTGTSTIKLYGKTFVGNTDQSTEKLNEFNTPIQARYIRYYPETWYGSMSMRAGVIVLE
jgi:hypothetical protein